MSNDRLHRFSFQAAPIRGQWVRLDTVLDQVFERQDYPPAVRTLLGEMLAAVSLMADGIKFRGAVALQSRSSGPVTTALAECRDQHLLRGIARWNEEEQPALSAGPHYEELSTLLGEGRMAISLLARREPGRAEGDGTSYQGVIGIAAGDLARNLEDYFANSEQLPTRLFFAMSDSTVTGLLLQRLPAPDNATEVELDQHAALWHEVELLASTLRPEELGGLPVETLLRRLFHEHPVTLQPARELEFSCTCSRQRAEQMLQALPKEELLELLETRGSVDVTCEVCGARYEYDKLATHLLYASDEPTVH